MFSKPLPWDGKRKILLTTHASPDADGLGSILALGSLLEKEGKQVTYLVRGGLPKNLNFLVGEKIILEDIDNLAEFDLVGVLDCADLQLTKIEALASGNRTWQLVNIDHHPDNKQFGDHNLVNANFSATAQIIYELFLYKNLAIDGFCATAILAGLISDTGGFKHSNTTSAVFNCAARLLESGGRLLEIVNNLFASKDEAQLRAWSYVLENARYDEASGAIIAAVTAEDLSRLKVDDNAFEGVVEILNTYPKAKLAALGRQQGNEVKFSLRSEVEKGVDVSALASKFGGGGHKLAAGFRVPGKLRRENGNVVIESNIEI